MEDTLMTLDYTTAAGYAAIIIGILYTLIETKRLGVTTFVIKVYNLIDTGLVLLKISNARQPFIVGSTQLEEDEIFARLIALGYQWDYLAFFDSGEIISMRWCYEKRQVHCRVFKDGEIRMHDEPNYEYDPIAHLNDAPRMPSPDHLREVLTSID
jgi:hypothetical protein